MSATKTNLIHSNFVECPVCCGVFESGVISEHANTCLNRSSEMDESRKRKRKSTDWDFMTGYSSKTSDKNAALSTKISKSTQSKGKSKVGGGPSKAKDLVKTTDNREGADSSSDVEFVECDEKEVLENTKPTKIATDEHQQTDNTTMNKINSIKIKDTATGLFNHAKKSKPCSVNNVPLAERVRPLSFDNFVGQDQAVGRKSILHNLITSTSNIPSMILWGPPGCGKTTLAKIIAQKCKEQGNIKFITMSATSASVSDVKEVAKIARNDLKMFRRKTILFLDEIHRFNKTQQDVLLPHVEDGTVTLIGATTENPSFYVNGALLSRCRVITLEKLQIEDISAIIKRALPLMEVSLRDEGSRQEGDSKDMDPMSLPNRSPKVIMETAALDALVGLVDGDARIALNGLQLAVEGSLALQGQMQVENGVVNSEVKVTVDIVKEALQRSHVLYDKTGEEHYNTISALIKSLRGSDPSAALYWMSRILEGGENPLFIARRLVVFASEDVGLADPLALTQAVSTHQACHFIGMPECALNLAQCVVYLARAPKSNEVYRALQAARNCVKNHEGSLPPVPLHLRNAPTKLMKKLGYGKDYKYPHDYSEPVEQDYFPPSLIGTDFFSTS